mmetsp:Transcript_21330/g.51692  ORF Transcript_21330/g.51692 Transcript_21330/m.51692 type:complete len:526 (-) Transcript_21330:786-2363(-)
MLLHDRLHGGLVLSLDVGENQPLIACHAELADISVRQLAQPLLLAASHAALLNVDTQVVTSRILHPADGVSALGELEGSRWLELGAEQILHLRPVPVNTIVVDGVLQASVLAVAPASVITLHRNHHLRHVFGLVLLNESEHGPQPRERRAVVVGVPEATTDDDVEPLQLVVLNDGDEPDIVGVDIHVVVRRDGHSHLELPRQIGLAVQRLLLEGSAASDLVLLVGHGVVQDEDLVPRPSLGKAVIVDLLGVLDALIHQCRSRRHGITRAANHSRDISAGGNRVHARSLDHAHAFDQVVLLDPLQLPSLPRGDLQIGLAQGRRDLVDSPPLSRVAITCGLPNTNHEAERVLQTQRLALGPHVSIILLINPVVLDDDLVRLRDAAGGAVSQGSGKGSSEVVGVVLGLLRSLVRSLVCRSARIISSLQAHGLAQLLLPHREPRPVPVRVLLVRDGNVQQGGAAKIRQLLVQPPAGSSEVLRLRPVLAVAQGQRGEGQPLHILLPALQVLPEPSAVRREFPLASSAGHE